MLRLPLLLALLLASVPLSAADGRIKFQSTTLPNGLTVVTHEDRAMPVVAVNIWYKVGSKNEQAGRTGFAHLFEHYMFEGSAHSPSGEYFQRIFGMGGNTNANTTNDRTDYFAVVPSENLEEVLRLESDRMGFLRDSINAKSLDKQRAIVKNEKRLGENRAYGETEHVRLHQGRHREERPFDGTHTAFLHAPEQRDAACENRDGIGPRARAVEGERVDAGHEERANGSHLPPLSRRTRDDEREQPEPCERCDGPTAGRRNALRQPRQDPRPHRRVHDVVPRRNGPVIPCPDERIRIERKVRSNPRRIEEDVPFGAIQGAHGKRDHRVREGGNARDGENGDGDADAPARDRVRDGHSREEHRTR